MQSSQIMLVHHRNELNMDRRYLAMPRCTFKNEETVVMIGFLVQETLTKFMIS